MSEFIGGRIVPVHGGAWDNTKEYETLTIVRYKPDGDSYISRRAVPAGTAITDTNYWMLYSLYSQQIADAIAEMEETDAALREELTAAEQRMEERVSDAETLTNSNKATLETRMGNIEARLDANVSASTDSNADYAAEVVDARVGWDNTAYASLGAALRGLAGQSWKYAGILYRNKGTEDLNDLETNTVYLVSSSSGDTTLGNFPDYNGHGLLITTGVTEGYIYQIFLGGGNRVFSRYHIKSTGWSSWADLFSGIDTEFAGVEEEFADLYETLAVFGVEDILHKNASFSGSHTVNGVTFTVNDDGSVTADGTASEEVNAFYNMYADQETRLDGINEGEAYVFRLTGDTDNISLQAYVYTSGDTSAWKQFVSTKSSAEAAVPEGGSGFLVRLRVAEGVTVDNETVYPSISRKYTAEEYHEKALKYAGTLYRNGGTEDLNDLAANTIYLVSSSSGDTTLVNFPDYTSHGILVTAGADGGYTYQLFITASVGKLYLRFRYSSGVWAGWKNITEQTAVDVESEAEGFRGTNPNCHMLSFGNSILSGSVWTDGKYDHLSAYYNAPYGNIANAMGIPKSNVHHTVVSSTGLLYDAGNGSFLDHIKASDLAGYDVVLTHLWTGDMNKYDVGTADAEAGDGTIAGGVVELVGYMADSNGGCQLVLVGVPPVSSTIYGDAVFSTAYPNGSSIEELDVVMHGLAEKYRFVYIDWQGLNLSYYYHDYSDGTNVHANNEDTYRIMGGYLGGRASAKLRF